jgi:HNH endonuclease
VSDFSPSVSVDLLAACRRYCCVCLRWAGQRMHLHHIIAKSDGGSGDFDNGIPVCLDCHAEIESTSNMGRKFTAPELKKLRDQWFETVKNHAEVLIRAAQSITETGPLQALLAELDFNRMAVRVDKTVGCPPLHDKQFERAIATNALEALDKETRESIQSLYVRIARFNHALDELARMQRIKEDRIVGVPAIPALDTKNAMQKVIAENISETMRLLTLALGGEDASS